MAWQFDPNHTQVEFSAKHLGMMTVRGTFTDVIATGELYPDNPETSSVEVTLQTASIRTNNANRDNDLRSSNFLEADKYPTVHFKSTKIEQAGANRYIVSGDLTIKGVTHPLTLTLTKYGEFNDPRMGHRIAYSGEGKIDRREYGMTFNAMLDGKWVVSDEIQISLEGELIEKPDEQPQADQSATAHA